MPVRAPAANLWTLTFEGGSLAKSRKKWDGCPATFAKRDRQTGKQQHYKLKSKDEATRTAVFALEES